MSATKRLIEAAEDLMYWVDEGVPIDSDHMDFKRLEQALAAAKEEAERKVLTDHQGHLPEGVDPITDAAHYIAASFDHLKPWEEDEDGDLIECAAYHERVEELQGILAHVLPYLKESGYLAPTTGIDVEGVMEALDNVGRHEGWGLVTVAKGALSKALEAHIAENRGGNLRKDPWISVDGNS